MGALNVLVCCTGSVATIKLPLLLESIRAQLQSEGEVELKVILSERAKHFCEPESVVGAQVLTDEDEWSMWKGRGDPVLHIDLTKWAHLMLIAPLDANTLGKIASGICDNLLTCAVRAWDVKKPLLFCPAMNTKMWEHPITSEQINRLTSFGYVEVPCIAKTLMCGDTGLGAMAEPSDIAAAVRSHLLHSDFNRKP